MFDFFSRKKRRVAFYNRLVVELETGDPQAIANLLWHPKDSHIQYLPVTFEILDKLKKPADVDQLLGIHKWYRKGRYELIIFHKTWPTESPYSPVLIDMKAEKIIGIMLPFNELHNFLPARASSAFSYLSSAWISLIVSYNLK